MDEWAYRKRLNFKTILVDLSTNRLFEMLPDASATTCASWLQNHPEVKVIVRDRAGSFAEGRRVVSESNTGTCPSTITALCKLPAGSH